jgi:hypothetical protein
MPFFSRNPRVIGVTNGGKAKTVVAVNAASSAIFHQRFDQRNNMAHQNLNMTRIVTSRDLNSDKVESLSEII